MTNAFKVTTWNVEWLVDAFNVAEGRVEPSIKYHLRRMPSMDHAMTKLNGIGDEVAAIDPDILLVLEAIPDQDDMQSFVNKYLAAYRLVVRTAPDQDYDIKGEQWIWFIVKETMWQKLAPELLPVKTWKDYTAKVSASGHADGKWVVSVPSLDEKTKTVGPNHRKKHLHHRHPQLLVVNWEGSRVELVGVHFKSKHIGINLPARKAEETEEQFLSRGDVTWFLANAHVARAKLTTEATDVRLYIEQRFAQDELPAIFVLGDLNDGPGKELIEREYLLHDLIGSLQGDVFLARQFLNHALFDYPDDLRWTAYFEDKLEPMRNPKLLIDHIAFTEGLSRRGLGKLIVNPKAGLVEHEIHDRINSLFPPKLATSDHRPVSLQVSIKDPVTT